MITDEGQIHAEAVCRRKDFRRLFEQQHQPPIASCITMSGSFQDRVQDLSSKGVFLATIRNLSLMASPSQIFKHIRDDAI